jgi:predicted O-linked N-acetylglucosamine transferase (SPINDLY family)
LSKGRRYNHQRLRLGYISGDLCVHAVGLLLAEFLEAHDKSQFMLYGYDYSVEDHTAHRARLRATFEVFRSVAPLSDRDIATLIVEDEIDILIDLHGLSSGARPGIFALNPGVLQGTYLGFIGTTGMPWLDFVVSDRHALPDELVPYFAEKPLYLEGSFIPLTDQRPDFKISTRQDNGLPEKAFVMASFGNVYKINEPLFSTWMDILQAAPDAVLWLIDDNASATANLRQFAASRGVDSDRLIFTPRVTHQAYRGNLRLVDLFLDTFPYNCGSTTNDVLEAGVPLLTCQGRTMVSRMGASILRSQGQDALVTSSLAEYKALAIRLANGQLMMTPPAAPAPLRAHARQHMVRSLEAGLVAMLQHKLAQR